MHQLQLSNLLARDSSMLSLTPVEKSEQNFLMWIKFESYSGVETCAIHSSHLANASLSLSAISLTSCDCVGEAWRAFKVLMGHGLWQSLLLKSKCADSASCNFVISDTVSTQAFPSCRSFGVDAASARSPRTCCHNDLPLEPTQRKHALVQVH